MNNKHYGATQLLLQEIQNLRSKISESEKAKNDFDHAKKSLDHIKSDLTSIKVGDKAIYPDFPLVWTKDKEKFTVTYEVEIVEVSDKKVKIKGIDYTTDNKRAQDPTAKAGVLDHISDKWFNKSEIELIVDDRKLRDIKLSEILDQ